jgi:hypothetical protein
MKGFLVLFIALLALVAHSCKELPTQTEPPVALALSLIDSTCTDLELKLSAQPRAQRIVVERLAQPQPVIIFDAVLNTPDTMILDKGLLPNTTYTYRAYRLANNTKRDTSRALHARTMDTTSHDWAWTMQTFGVASSQLDDVAIVNDTLAYAVGKIYLNDSLGQLDYTPYNLAIWNGQRWRFERVYWTFQGNQGVSHLTAIMAFSSNDIWVGGTVPYHWNGISWRAELGMVGIFASWINKIWGRSSSDLYIVGNNGNIAHYNGSSWRRVESGTSLDIYDVYGDGEEVLAVAADAFSGIQGSKLIRLNGDQPATLLSPQSLSTATLNGLWFMSNRRYLGVGSRNFEKRRRDGQEWEAVSVSSLGNNWTIRVTGQAINDLFITATSSQILHFNGVSWRNFQNHLPDGEKWFRGIKVKHNLVIAVGIDVSSPSTRAVVAIGRRN